MIGMVKIFIALFGLLIAIIGSFAGIMGPPIVIMITENWWYLLLYFVSIPLMRPVIIVSGVLIDCGLGKNTD